MYQDTDVDLFFLASSPLPKLAYCIAYNTADHPGLKLVVNRPVNRRWKLPSVCRVEAAGGARGPQ